MGRGAEQSLSVTFEKSQTIAVSFERSVRLRSYESVLIIYCNMILGAHITPPEGALTD